MKRMMTIIGGVVLMALLVIGGAFAQQAKYTGSIRVKGEDEAGFPGLAKISFDSAMNAALKEVPGSVLKVELENEDGYLVYGVEIVRADRQIADVKVDAGSGKVLKVEADQEDNEGREGEDSDNGHEKGGER